MYQIQKRVEGEIAPDVWVFDKYQNVGPEFEISNGLYNYIKAVIHPNDFSSLYVLETWSDDDSMVGFDCESFALDEWCTEFEKSTMTDEINIIL